MSTRLSILQRLCEDKRGSAGKCDGKGFTRLAPVLRSEFQHLPPLLQAPNSPSIRRVRRSLTQICLIDEKMSISAFILHTARHGYQFQIPRMPKERLWR